MFVLFTISTLDLVQSSWTYSSDSSCQGFVLSVSILPFDFEAGDPGACFYLIFHFEFCDAVM